MKRFVIWVLMISMIVGCMVGCGSHETPPKTETQSTEAPPQTETQSSGVFLDSMETAVQNAFSDTTAALNITDVDDGKTFVCLYDGGFSGMKVINGAADTNSNIKWIEYRIQDFDEEMFEEVTFDSLKKDLKNFQNIPMGKLNAYLGIMAYSNIIACIDGNPYSDYYGLDTVLNAKTSEQRKGDWVYNTSMDGSAMLIRAEFMPE